MKPRSQMTGADVNLDSLAAVIRQNGRPQHINALAQAALRCWLETTPTERTYTAGAKYARGEQIRLNGQAVVVQDVRAASNPKQGQFTILTLRFPDGTTHQMAAEVPGGPPEVRKSVSQATTSASLDGGDAVHVRTVVHEALRSDQRFSWFQNSLGDHYCLTDMLPVVGKEELDKAAAVLCRELENGEPLCATSEELVRAVWDEGDDGSSTYALRAFALERALSGHSYVICLCDHWVWAETWRAFVEREPLLSPRMPTHVDIPNGIVQPSAAEADKRVAAEVNAEAGIEPGPGPGDTEEFEQWRTRPKTVAVFTLSARHYYEGWLPLSKDLRRLFPPFDCGRQQVVFHHQFGSEPASFLAWVDRHEGRIWVSLHMYETLREHGIYPGARLRLAARNEREYDIATQPPKKTEPIHIWRMWLDEDEHIQYEAFDEPRKYDIDDDVFVADVRFEGREALFQQAQEAANSIFGLMYTQAVKWWEANERRDLYVTAQELFDAIHYDPQQRMTYKVTIAWELWRRLAFEAKGEGRYRFRPEFGGRVRYVEPKRAPKPLPARPGPQAGPPRDPWAELEPDKERMAALQAAVQRYMADPAREKVLFLRQLAHARIRELLAKGRLETLTLDDFNRQIWQIGSFRYQDESYRIDTDQADALLGRVGLEQLKEASRSGDLAMQGNQTWGSSSSVIGCRLHKSAAEMEKAMREALRLLLYGKGEIEQRMEFVVRQPNGLGMNVVTGIVHATYPDEHILYNNRSVDALEKLGMRWPPSWQRDAGTYQSYKRFCHQLRANLGFQSVSDVDWFMYRLGTGKVLFSVPGPGAERAGPEVSQLQVYHNYSRQQVHDILAPDTPFAPSTGAWGLLGIVPVLRRDGDFAFFVTLGQEQAGHVFEEWISQDGVLNWQSQPGQALDDRVIQEFIHHDERQHHIYLFLRTRKRSDYTYLGELKYLWHDPQRERPVYFHWQILDWHISPAKLAEMGLQLRSGPQPAKGPEPAAVVPDIGVRDVLYPIPFRHVQLPDDLFRDRRWAKVLPGRQLALFPEPRTPDYVDQLLMQRIADKTANRFVTPREVVDFMVNLAQPKPRERVADICCGTGIFLVKALRFVREVHGESVGLELYGADIYGPAVEATQLNLVANGARNSTVVCLDSLQEQGGIFAQRYDLILGNPPFGAGQAESFLRRWLEMLQPGGRMVVNVPEGILANASRRDRNFRQWLVGNFELEAVVSLPRPKDSNLYGAKSNVMFVRHHAVSASHLAPLVSISDYDGLPIALHTVRVEGSHEGY
jgi:protein-L-isoaspartate O-methyltransferase